MSNRSREPSGIRFFDAIRRAFIEGWTGRLGLNSADLRGQLFFVGGDLYLSPEHPFQETAAAWLDSVRAAKRRESTTTREAPAAKKPTDRVGSSQSAVEARLALRRLVTELSDLLYPCAGEACHFVDGAGQIRLDLIGPLPTGRLVMETSVLHRGKEALLRTLGGAGAALVASSVDDFGPSGLELDPPEAFLLSRLEKPLTVADLLQQVRTEQSEVLRNLCRLLSVGLISGESTAVGSSESSAFGSVLVERLSERIAASLDKEPVTLSTEEHRELLGNLLGRIGEMTHFELLAVSPQSTVDEVQRAFMELGRLVHPSHAGRLALVGGEKGLRILMERATEAYYHLSDSERRAAYFEKIGPLQVAEANGASAEERQRELKAAALRNYQLARNLADRQEFHAAIQLLEQSVKADPKSEYLVLLAECQSYNPRWLDRAVQNLSRAVEQQPQDGTLRLRLGNLLERQGDSNGARREYQAAVETGPETVAAQEALERVGGPGRRSEGKSFWETIRSLLTRRSVG